MDLLIISAVIVLLIGFNAFFVAVEFSAVSARRARVAQLADEGSAVAQRLLTIFEDPQQLDMYISSCQLGITIASLTLGFYGQESILEWLAPTLARLDGNMQVLVQSITALMILLLLTALQVILGELVPKNIGLRYPERLAILTAGPMQWVRLLFRPLIWVLNGSARAIVRLLGAQAINEHAHIHSPEEIMMLVEESSAGGVLDKEERRLLVNTLQLRHVTARRVMIPRNQMLAAALDDAPEAMLALLATSPYSRLPLYEESIDKIVGMVHIKDLLLLVRRSEDREQRAENREQRAESRGQRTENREQRAESREQRTETGAPSAVRSIMYPVQFIPDSTLIEEVMTQMQRKHHNLAIVIDEYGGTAGMIAFEDLVEEIIGEFQDEFDATTAPVKVRGDNRISVRGDVDIEDLNTLLDLELPDNVANTIGGLVTSTLGEIPEVGETVELAGTTIHVDKMERNRVAEVSITVSPEQVARVQEAQT
ncbi:MAG: hemolysin family protein [Caldilineaceae bacterium]